MRLIRALRKTRVTEHRDMKSLQEPGAVDSIVARLNNLRPDSERRWGAMTANGMICHLADSLKFTLGERPVSLAISPVGRYLLKYLALYSPLPWPKGYRTRPEAAQEFGGTQPGSFDEDRRHLISLVRRISTHRPGSFPPHPVFGPMTQKQWMRLVCMHIDHHLRQFGV
jgi:hypothetical protein